MATNKKDNTPAKVEEQTTAMVAASLEGDAGAGFENQTGDDIIMPVFHLLQALSPQVADGTVDGARPGLLFNSVDGGPAGGVLLRAGHHHARVR